MKEKSQDEIDEEIAQMATVLLKNWSATQDQIEEDEDPEAHFQLWVIEKLARAMVFAGDINSRLPEMEVRIEYLEEGRRRPPPLS